MPETKADTALKVSNVKRLESELAKTKEEARTSIVAVIGEHISELTALGFFYSLEESKRIGRPKKESGDGI